MRPVLTNTKQSVKIKIFIKLDIFHKISIPYDNILNLLKKEQALTNMTVIMISGHMLRVFWIKDTLSGQGQFR